MTASSFLFLALKIKKKIKREKLNESKKEGTEQWLQDLYIKQMVKPRRSKTSKQRPSGLKTKEQLRFFTHPLQLILFFLGPPHPFSNIPLLWIPFCHHLSSSKILFWVCFSFDFEKRAGILQRFFFSEVRWFRTEIQISLFLRNTSFLVFWSCCYRFFFLDFFSLSLSFFFFLIS